MQLKLVPNSHRIKNALTVSNHSNAAILTTSTHPVHISITVYYHCYWTGVIKLVRLDS